MPEAILEKLDQALSKIDRPGTFCVSGSVPAVLPGLEVKGLGTIGLPLTAKTAKELKEQCEQAPYGKGTETLVDTNVRRVWRMEPGRFALTNPEWKRLIEETVRKVQEELGLEKQKLESHLYDLLLYEPGSFFLPHRDGEKLDRMVATLVVVLPSSHEGGELVVRHDGQEQTIDFSGTEDSQFHIHFAAFYADCEHEVRPLRKGYRLCLVYNLTLAKLKKSISAPRDSEHIERIAPLLREWAADDSAEKLVITLDHQYTQDGLAWDTLKGVDRVKARVLLEAARQAGCKAYLALLTFWESGSAEYAGGGGYRSGRRRRWDDYDDEDEDDASQYEMGEIFDSSLTAKHLIDSEGNGLPLEELSVEEEDLLDPDSLTDVEPEEEFEGYTGNEGMTLERWYRHAAIFLWPERRHFEILCDRDSREVIPVLNQMVKRWRQSGADDAAALKAQCIDLATAILARWREHRYARAHPQESGTGNLLETLVALDDPKLIRDFLGDVMAKDASVDPGKSLVAVCQSYGWGTFPQELLTVMKGTTNDMMERNVRLLEQICLAKPRKKEGWRELCATLAHRTRRGHRGDRSGTIDDRLVCAESGAGGSPRRAGPIADRHRPVRLAGACRGPRPGRPEEVSADARARAGAGKPSALAQEECQEALCRIEAVARRVPGTTGISHGSSPPGTPRLPSHGRDHLPVPGLRRAETIPGGSAREGASIQHEARSSHSSRARNPPAHV